MEESYTGFAEVYDAFMDNIPYGKWADFLRELLVKYDSRKAVAGVGEEAAALRAERNTLLDLGCGTGSLTELFSKMGYDVIGIDASEEMLEIATRKAQEKNLDILYLLQDMREFELYSTVGVAVSTCNSLNYILKEKDMEKIFSLVNNYLYPGGLFLFDFDTEYKYREVLGESTIAENRKDASFIWETCFDEREEILEQELTVFIKNNRTGEYKKNTEYHYQKGYELSQMKALLEKAGLVFVEAWDADTGDKPMEKSERILVLARECGK